MNTTSPAGAGELTETERTAPEEIYLNVCEDVFDMRLPFPKGCAGDEVGWNTTPQLDGHVRYVRADLATTVAPKVPIKSSCQGNFDNSIDTPPTVSAPGDGEAAACQKCGRDPCNFWSCPWRDGACVSKVHPPAPSAPLGGAVALDLDYYDAGLLNDYGGGNVQWWQDYIRNELGRAHAFYQSQIDATPKPDLAPLVALVGRWIIASDGSTYGCARELQAVIQKMFP